MKYIKGKNIYGKLLFIVILSVTFFLISGAVKQTENKTEKPSIQHGILDMSNWNPSHTGNINLIGQWEFYWQKLLTYEDFLISSTKPDLLAEVPKVWNTYKINDKSLSGFGYATYRLRVIDVQEGEALAIRMPTVSTAYNLYINDRLIAFNGKVSMGPQHFMPEYRPILVQFISPSSDFDIILQVANFSYARGGVWYPIYIGSAESMAQYDKNIGYKDLFLLGAFLIMALYYTCIYFMRREDKSSIFFVLLCIIAIGRTIIYGDYIINSILPWNGYPLIVAMDYLATTWAPVAFIFLVGELFPKHTSQKNKKLFTIYAIIISVFIIISPIYVFTIYAIPIQVIAVVMMGYTVICVAKAYPKNKLDSTIVIVGVLAAALGGIHDALYHNNIIFSDFGELSSVGFLIFLFLQAITLARRFSEAFKESKLLSEKLIKLDKLKDEFLANTSHEIRTPLNAIINIAEGMARESEGSINEKQKESLAIITSSGRQLASLLNDILDYSKLKNFDLKMKLEPLSLKRSVESVMNSFGRLNKIEVVQMIIDISDDIPYIYADENRVLQILYNLVGNAMKFTKTGHIKVSAVRVGDMVEACVEDTGIGIPEDKLDIIFESFRQIEDSLIRRSGGAGLGLSITKYLVEAQGGRISVKSKVGEGSKFKFSIPIATQAGREQTWQHGRAETEIAASGYDVDYATQLPRRYKGDGPHIILVDDNKANLMALVSILKVKNYSITPVCSSEEFLEIFKETEDVALVILDVMLPDLSGYDICREIRKRFSVTEMPVLMLTAKTASQDIVMGMEAGANDYLSKPFDTDELLARVNTLIQLKQSADKSLASELAFLQAQIKPHFLYNALNTFVSISLYDMDKARNLIIEFGNYLRRSFDFKDLRQFVSVKNELEFVRAYLEIEKARFEERIDVVYDFPEDVEVKVPILVLQPIVENAVVHGILPKDEGGRIEICIIRVEEGLHFMVKDNGVGMDLEKKSRLFDQEFGSSVGLSNIDNRLKKLYGAGLKIKSISGVGTEVTWSVPMYQRGSK